MSKASGHLGVSNFGVVQLAEAVATGVPLVVNDLPYNLLSRAIEPELLPACARHGLGVLGYTPLARCNARRRFNSFAELAVESRQ